MSDQLEAAVTPENRDTDRRAKVWRFNPEITTGNLLTIAVGVFAAIAAYGTYEADKTQTKNDIDAVKVTAARDREDMKTSFDSLRSDLKELKTNVDKIGENVTVLKAQQPPVPRK